MGLTVITEINSESMNINTTYRCSNCGIDILKTETRRDEFFEIDWNSLPSFCYCGEKLTGTTTICVPLIDKAENFEINGE